MFGLAVSCGTKGHHELSGFKQSPLVLFSQQCRWSLTSSLSRRICLLAPSVCLQNQVPLAGVLASQLMLTRDPSPQASPPPPRICLHKDHKVCLTDVPNISHFLSCCHPGQNPPLPEILGDTTEPILNSADYLVACVKYF